MIKFASFAHGRWFSPGTLASSTTKTGRHDIAEILLKVALNTKNQSVNQYLLNNIKAYTYFCLLYFSSIQITISWFLIPVEHTVKNGNSKARMFKKTDIFKNEWENDDWQLTLEDN